MRVLMLFDVLSKRVDQLVERLDIHRERMDLHQKRLDRIEDGEKAETEELLRTCGESARVVAESSADPRKMLDQGFTDAALQYRANRKVAPDVVPRCPDGSPDWDTHMRCCGGCEDCKPPKE
jgi:hypothetical protein